jgi:hypothetical protein
VAAKSKVRKVRAEEAEMRCVSGVGLVREELWEDGRGRVVRYNLAFINHFLMAEDNGRVLGYDTSHGYHHRHFNGKVEPFDFLSYEETLARFISEVSILREEEL